MRGEGSPVQNLRPHSVPVAYAAVYELSAATPELHLEMVTFCSCVATEAMCKKCALVGVPLQAAQLYVDYPPPPMSFILKMAYDCLGALHENLPS